MTSRVKLKTMDVAVLERRCCRHCLEALRREPVGRRSAD
jgi:hypothetical protein